MKVECPRCGRIWTLRQGTPGVECTCHLFCEDGSEPSDCNMTPVSFTGEFKWPLGLHTDAPDNSDDIMHLTYYCSTHGKYSKKVPIFIEADWDRWFSRRAPKKLRMSHGQY